MNTWQGKRTLVAGLRATGRLVHQPRTDNDVFTNDPGLSVVVGHDGVAFVHSCEGYVDEIVRSPRGMHVFHGELSVIYHIAVDIRRQVVKAAVPIEILVGELVHSDLYPGGTGRRPEKGLCRTDGWGAPGVDIG